MPPIVYWNAKLSHNGVTVFKKFEGFTRRIHHHSLANLIHEVTHTNERTLSPAQSRKCKSYCNKLAYYSATRMFTSKKSGTHNMRVAFITLTTPKSATYAQSLAAFEKFLDYLRRTANCVFVWKKELGEQNRNLHYHILVNNFIPYYIISWKWKRLLLSEGVVWPTNEKGEHTDSHYRIELPRSKKLVGSYIAKYMSKAYALPRTFGYVFGHSAILDECKELTMTEGDEFWNELNDIARHSRKIGDDYVVHMCIDLLHVKAFAPGIGALFEKQYLSFCEALTMTQKFNTI